MITFIDGVLEEKEPTRAVVNAGGVGYEVFIPLSSYDRLPNVGDRFRVLTYHHVREDIQALYGFMTDAERKLFLLLLTVSGIGPKIAMNALSGISVRDFKAAIVEADAKRLSSVSGIGKKTAERIIVELKDKLSVGEALEAVAGGEAPSGDNILLRDAILALVSLGYKQQDAQQRIKTVLDKKKDVATVEELVRRSLTLAQK